MIESSVGLRAVNRHKDVITVQKLLKHKGFPHLRIDGICGENTIKAIIAYQKHFYHAPDGIISPGKRTIEYLSSQSPNHALPQNFGATQSNLGGKRTNPQLLSPSFNCLQLMMKYEQLHTKPYDDQSGENISFWVQGATIGYGHLISEHEFSDYESGITQPVAQQLFTKDISRFILAVRNYVKVDITQNEFDALVMFAFNIGTRDNRHHRGLYYSTVLKIINGESTEDLDTSWMKYTTSQGHRMRGLFNRRTSELKVYHQGVYIKI